MLKNYVDKINVINNSQLYDYDSMSHISYLIDNMIIDVDDESDKKIDFINILGTYYENTGNLYNLLSIIKNSDGIDNMYKYMTYGGNCIVFKNNSYVLKLCKQNREIYNQFLIYSNNISWLSLARVVAVIYTDDDYIIYVKKYYEPVTNITKEILIGIIEFYYLMIINKIIFQDIYFRNFGIDDNNRLIFFDYHYRPTNCPNEFDIINMILNILHVFKGDHYDKLCYDGFRYDYSHYAANIFQIPEVPMCIAEYLLILNDMMVNNGQEQNEDDRSFIINRLRSKINDIYLFLEFIPPP
jgi:hypothetical protein